MQNLCKGHTIDNEDTMITFIYSSTLRIYFNHICISVGISIQPWLASRHKKVFLRNFVVYKILLLHCPLELMYSAILTWIRATSALFITCNVFVTITFNQGNSIKTTLPFNRNTMLCLLVLPVC